MRVEVASQTENLTPMYESIVEECEGQSSLLQSEIKRLQDQRATLYEMIKYIEVGCDFICFMDRMLAIHCNLVSAYCKLNLVWLKRKQTNHYVNI